MESKLRKSLGILVLVLLMIALAFVFNKYSSSKQTIDSTTLKNNGYFNLETDNTKISNSKEYTLRLNAKKIWNKKSVSRYNETSLLYSIPTTLQPNNDGKLYQANWKLAKDQDNNLNYFYVEAVNKEDSFYVAAIQDFKSISNGYPVVFTYIDSVDFFSDSTGIYVVGINKDEKQIKRGGNYAMRGKEWERKIYYQLYNSDGILLDNGWTGNRIHGNLSRAAPQKSLRFYAREKYGKEDFFSLFTKKETKQRFILRTPFASNKELIYKDAMIGEVANSLGMDAMQSTPVIHYLNGEYWGYTNYRERVDEQFFFEKYSIDSLDFVDLYFKAKYGSANDYKDLNKWINKHDLRLDANYKEIATKVDLENFKRYLLIELFFANKDWPHNNVRIWKSSELDNKWRWLVFDLDAAGLDNVDMADHFDYQSSEKFRYWIKNLLLGLLSNEEFYGELIEEYLLLKEDQLDVNSLIAQADSLKDLYIPLLPDQIQRWSFPSSIDHFEEMHDGFIDFLYYRDKVILDEMERIHQSAMEYQSREFDN